MDKLSYNTIFSSTSDGYGDPMDELRTRASAKEIVLIDPTVSKAIELLQLCSSNKTTGPRSIALIMTQGIHSTDSLFEQEAVVTALADPGGAALRVRDLPEQHTQLLELAAYGRGAVAIAKSLPGQIAAAMDWWHDIPIPPESTLRYAMRSISETFEAIDQDSSHRLYETKHRAMLARLVQQCNSRSAAAARAVEIMCNRWNTRWAVDDMCIISQATAVGRLQLLDDTLIFCNKCVEMRLNLKLQFFESNKTIQSFFAIHGYTGLDACQI
jgi:hypothetical protein